MLILLGLIFSPSVKGGGWVGRGEANFIIPLPDLCSVTVDASDPWLSACTACLAGSGTVVPSQTLSSGVVT